MTDQPKRKSAASLAMPFDEAVARFLQTDPKEVADAHQRLKQAQEDTKRYVEERRESIQRGARRSTARFRP
jgi:hypothetical protein